MAKSVDIDLSQLHTHASFWGNRRTEAQVAELVDALASGASGRKAVEVRVFSWAPLSALIAKQPEIQLRICGWERRRFVD